MCVLSVAMLYSLWRLNRLAYEDVACNYESLQEHARRIKALEDEVKRLKDILKVY